VDFVRRMDDMAQEVGRDRLRYLLSVPVKWREPRVDDVGGCYLVTSWLRLVSIWTPDADTAVLFAQKMVQHGACLAVAFQHADCEQPGWEPGLLSSQRHPGRAVSDTPRVVLVCPIHIVASRRPFCYAILHDAMVQRGNQARRWDRRGGRVLWVTCVHASQ
jgi:hypothetical protein